MGRTDKHPHTLWAALYRDLREAGCPPAAAAHEAMPACVRGGYAKSGERFDAARIVQAVAAELTLDEAKEVLEAHAGAFGGGGGGRGGRAGGKRQRCK